MKKLLPLVALTACVAAPPEASAPPKHPHLADAPWPISHQSPWAQASSDLPVLDDPATARVERLRTGLVAITHATAPPHGDGRSVLWAASPLAVNKIARDGDLEVLASLPRSGGLGNLLSGAYTFVDAEGRFFASEGARVVRYDDDRADAGSPIVRGPELTLPDAAEGEAVVGLGLLWDGHVVFATSAARVGVATRDLELVDLISLGEDLTVSNDLATDETGAVFVVSSRYMHRVAWKDGALSLDASQGAWSAPYRVDADAGSAGRLGEGSGSTPTLLGTVGGERLVAITDAQALLHLVLFWADDVPEDWAGLGLGRDPRLAAETAITFGDPGATTSVSEQSVLASGWRMVVVNNDYGDAGTGIAPVLAGVAPPGIEQLTWDPVSRSLTSTWAVRDRSCPNGIPAMSRASNVALCLGRRGLTWTVEAFDWDDGSEAWHVPLGEDDGLNSVYAAVQVGEGGEILSGTFEGLVRVRPAP